jgi:hypothetical protein
MIGIDKSNLSDPLSIGAEYKKVRASFLWNRLDRILVSEVSGAPNHGGRHIRRNLLSIVDFFHQVLILVFGSLGMIMSHRVKVVNSKHTRNLKAKDECL